MRRRAKSRAAPAPVTCRVGAPDVRINVMPSRAVNSSHVAKVTAAPSDSRHRRLRPGWSPEGLTVPRGLTVRASPRTYGHQPSTAGYDRRPCLASAGGGLSSPMTPSCGAMVSSKTPAPGPGDAHLRCREPRPPQLVVAQQR
jgi:hypothetical protein